MGPAALIISELVSNVVDHAHTMMTIQVAVGDSCLYLAAHDGGSAPRPRVDRKNLSWCADVGCSWWRRSAVSGDTSLTDMARQFGRRWPLPMTASELR